MLQNRAKSNNTSSSSMDSISNNKFELKHDFKKSYCREDKENLPTLESKHSYSHSSGFNLRSRRLRNSNQLVNNENLLKNDIGKEFIDGQVTVTQTKNISNEEFSGRFLLDNDKSSDSKQSLSTLDTEPPTNKCIKKTVRSHTIADSASTRFLSNCEVCSSSLGRFINVHHLIDMTAAVGINVTQNKGR
ncbi:unnamed protein product [Heterobilharzia americana]|nr:unnamed protein product [Heterobilharzia americana]